MLNVTNRSATEIALTIISENPLTTSFAYSFDGKTPLLISRKNCYELVLPAGCYVCENDHCQYITNKGNTIDGNYCAIPILEG